jgi:hypothetical protein
MIIGPDTRVVGSFLKSSQTQICEVSGIAAMDLIV